VTLRSDLIPVVDDARELVDDLGLRPYTVAVRTRTWSGGRVGGGTASNADVTLAPRPRVREPSPRLQAAEPGRYEAGDRVVDRISATYTEADLDGDGLSADKERVWLIDGDEYRVVGKPLKRNFEWRVQLRRRTR